MTPSLGKKHEKLAPKLSEVVSPSPLMVGQCWLCTPCWCLEVNSSSSRWCSMLCLMLCQPHFQGDKPVELRWNIWALLNYWNCHNNWFLNQIVRGKACEPWSRLDANNVTRALRKTIDIIRTGTLRTRPILTCLVNNVYLFITIRQKKIPKYQIISQYGLIIILMMRRSANIEQCTISLSPLWPDKYVGKLDNIHPKSTSSAPSSPSWPPSLSSLWLC